MLGRTFIAARKCFFVSLLGSLNLVFLASTTTAATDDSLEKKLSTLFASTMQEQNIPGAAIVVIKDGKIIIKKGFGYSNLATGRKVDPDKTVFRIGSITKTMTVFAAVKLVEQGQLNYDTDISVYLPEFQIDSKYQPIKLKHLLSHSAGLEELTDSRQARSKERLVPLFDFLRNRLRPIRQPGQVPAYSTYAIATAGHIVEQKAGALESVLKDQLWDPCGMNMTSFEREHFDESDIAVGYEVVNGKNIPQRWEWYHTFPASSVNSTPADMAKYVQLFLNRGLINERRLLEVQSVEKMLTRQISGDPRITGIGLGFFENRWYGQTTWEHGGDMAGFSAYVLIDPKNQIGVFVAHHHEGTNLRYQAIDTIYKHFFGDQYMPTLPGKPDEHFYEKRSQKFVGQYRWLTESPTIDVNNATIWAISANKDNTLSLHGKKYVEVEPNYFRRVDGNNSIAFKEDDDGNIKYMFLGNVDAFQKIPANDN